MNKLGGGRTVLLVSVLRVIAPTWIRVARCAMRAQHIWYGVLLTTWACSLGVGIAQTASAQDVASRSDQLQIQQKHVARKPSSSANALTSVPAVGSEIASEAKSARAPVGVK